MDLNLLRILIESDKNRKLTAFMLYYFWQKDIERIKEYLITYATQDKMFSTDTANILPKVHRDITNKVLTNKCTVYHSGVDRYLTDENGVVDEEQTDLLNDIYQKAGIAQAQEDWYRSGKLFNCVEVKVVWRKATNQLEFDLWTPNFFSVWENEESVYIKDLIIFDVKKINEKGEEVEAKEVWSATEHYYLIEDGTIKSPLGKELTKFRKVDLDGDNPSFINPYAPIIPSQELRFKKGEDYYGVGDVALVEDNIWHDLELNNFKFVGIVQGTGIIYSVNMGKSGEVNIRPNTILAVNDIEANQETPFIQSVDTNAPLDTMNANLKENIENIMLMQGLSGSSATVDNSNAPGISKALDNEEMDLMRLDDKGILTDFENKLYEIVKVVYNKRTGETKLNEGLKFNCDFIDKVTPLNQSEKTNKWKFELEQGLKSKVDYLIEENPDLTVDQAKEILKENVKLKKEFDTAPELPPNIGGNPNVNGKAGLNQPPVKAGVDE